MKSFYRFLLICVFLIPASLMAEEPMKLRVERLSSYSPNKGWYVGEALVEKQGTEGKLRFLIGTETDVVDHYNADLTANSKFQSLVYTMQNVPQIYVLHGFSGSGADDVRGMKISKAVMERVGEENQINIEVEIPQVAYSPFGERIGTCDVSYMNYRVFLDELPAGTYKVNCVRKTVHIERVAGRMKSEADKITKTDIEQLKTFQLQLN